MDLPDLIAADQSTTPRHVFTVSELNSTARELLENSFPLIWIEAEISNLAKPASGHLYFTLKDPAAQVRCAMFKMRNRLLRFTPSDGQQVLVRAKVGLYEARGEFQLIVEHMELAGDGALRRQFEMLKSRLASEGLFDPQHKISLPEFPRRIGVITSPTGAAIKDVLSVLKRRFPATPVMLFPTAVQGESAANEIIAALETAQRRQDCDVLILCRGGGSLEDLWSFNDEKLARAIFACDIPIVCGVGHEIDFTIADFVADVRAPTPSAAAELVSPNAQEWLEAYSGLESRLLLTMRRLLSQLQQNLQWLGKRLQDPQRRLQQQAQRMDELEQRLVKAQQRYVLHKFTHLRALSAQLREHSPRAKVLQWKILSDNLSKRFRMAVAHQQNDRRQRLGAAVRALETVSPLATLSRGYAIVKKLPENTIVRSTSQVKKGTQLETQLHHGKLICSVDEIKSDN